MPTVIQNIYTDLLLHNESETTLIALSKADGLFSMKPSVNINRLEIGYNTATTTAGEIAIGYGANVLDIPIIPSFIPRDGIAIGTNATAGINGSIAIGLNSVSLTNSISIGNGATNDDSNAVTIGNTATVAVGGIYGVAVGSVASVSALQGVAVGYTTTVTADHGICIGISSTVQGARSLLLGYNSNSITGVESIGVGYNISIENDNIVVLGSNSDGKGIRSILIGYTNVDTATSDDAIAIGSGITAPAGVNFIAIGTNAGDGGGSIPAFGAADHRILIGPNTVTNASHTITIGNGAETTGTNGIAIGLSSSAGSDAVVVGPASVAAAESVIIGNGNLTGSANSVAIGNNIDTSTGGFTFNGIINVSNVAVAVPANNYFGIHTYDATPDFTVRRGKVELREYTVVTLPSVTNSQAGLSGLIVVTDEVGGRTLATSDGVNWRRVADGAIVS
jgi:hypothetical protein